MGSKFESAFFDEVLARCQFLVDELGQDEPVVSSNLVLRVRYYGAICSYSVVLDERQTLVDVTRVTPANSSYVTANLHDIIHSAGLAKRHEIKKGGQTLRAIRQALDSQVPWIRTVHPLVTGVDGVALLLRARSGEEPPRL